MSVMVAVIVKIWLCETVHLQMMKQIWYISSIVSQRTSRLGELMHLPCRQIRLPAEKSHHHWLQLRSCSLGIFHNSQWWIEGWMGVKQCGHDIFPLWVPCCQPHLCQCKCREFTFTLVCAVRLWVWGDGGWAPGQSTFNMTSKKGKFSKDKIGMPLGVVQLLIQLVKLTPMTLGASLWDSHVTNLLSAITRPIIHCVVKSNNWHRRPNLMVDNTDDQSNEAMTGISQYNESPGVSFNKKRKTRKGTVAL